MKRKTKPTDATTPVDHNRGGSCWKEPRKPSATPEKNQVATNSAPTAADRHRRPKPVRKTTPQLLQRRQPRTAPPKPHFELHRHLNPQIVTTLLRRKQTEERTGGAPPESPDLSKEPAERTRTSSSKHLIEPTNLIGEETKTRRRTDQRQPPEECCAQIEAVFKQELESTLNHTTASRETPSTRDSFLPITTTKRRRTTESHDQTGGTRQRTEDDEGNES